MYTMVLLDITSGAACRSEQQTPWVHNLPVIQSLSGPKGTTSYIAYS